ncbi:MerR family transcriptional regulator [Saccharomonospora xinjiangensis]|uniref:Putative transcriptional regulator n=1 Tax=Saccharomonospora xinjiangensis XJ-54 TaxID=882086 RepID=I0V0N2_9PSEU|nr:MerR family transcriptional regulator [Saccharomonospora xinjiangensis]EID53685.1 putative transcriptional regulator [Saccharomonospora xinjiangensis XJ-54]
MRMAELSRESGVPVATVKYYLREGLLHPGERTSPNQARYDEGHVRRLRLVRALLDVGGLSVSAVKDVVAAIDSPDTPMHTVLGVTQHGLPSARTAMADEQAQAWARARVDALLKERAWPCTDGSPLTESLVGLLATLRALGHTEFASVLDHYADAAQQIAETDVRHVAALPDPEATVETAVIGTVIGDALLATLRRMAHADVSARLFGGGKEINRPESG